VIYWHYTNGASLWGILADRTIKPNRRDFKRPNIWLSKNPAWEPGASRGGDGPLTAEEMAAGYGGIFRIGVDDFEVPLLPWLETARAGGMPEYLIKFWWGTTFGLGHLADWAGTFEEIPARFWRHVEYGDALGELWAPLNGAMALDAIRVGLKIQLDRARKMKAEIENRIGHLVNEPPERIDRSPFTALPQAVNRFRRPAVDGWGWHRPASNG
jgi:hypothetical protein